MPKLRVFEGSYYSQADESAFFAWLESIPGVTSVIGTPFGLEVTLRSKALSQTALRELLAIHYRYGLPMKDLAQFRTLGNSSWFENPSSYWHAMVFGPNAVSANIEARILELQQEKTRAIQVARSLKRECGLSLDCAKRFLRVFDVWSRKNEDRPRTGAHP